MWFVVDVNISTSSDKWTIDTTFSLDIILPAKYSLNQCTDVVISVPMIASSWPGYNNIMQENPSIILSGILSRICFFKLCMDKCIPPVASICGYFEALWYVWSSKTGYSSYDRIRMRDTVSKHDILALETDYTSWVQVQALCRRGSLCVACSK